MNVLHVVYYYTFVPQNIYTWCIDSHLKFVADMNQLIKMVELSNVNRMQKNSVQSSVDLLVYMYV